MKNLATTIVLVALAGIAMATSPDLQVSLAAARSTTAGPTENFVGHVEVERLYTPPVAAADERTSVGSVTFAAGARTAWHTHPRGQTLIVTSGVGRVQRWDGQVQEIRPGDVVRIPAGVKHWHGAAPDSTMTHIAVTEVHDGSTVTWLEQVSDAQYSVKLSKVTSPTPAQPTRAQQLMGDIAPKLAELTDEVLFGDIWERPGLSKRDRSLVTISALIAMNRPDQLRSHIALGRQHGLTQPEIVEAITQLAFYAGWPSAVTGATLAKEVFLPKPATGSR
jgi:4-carboxymuconolactone decarboxylase